MQRKRSYIKGMESARPQFVITPEPLEFEDENLSKMDICTRLVLQTLGEELMHELGCPHCQERKNTDDLPDWMIDELEDEV